MQDAPGGQGDVADATRSDLALERQALRNDWPVPPSVRTKVLRRLIDYLDRECDEGATAPDRTVLMAARTLAAFCGLSLKQQALDLRRERLAGRDESALAELVAEAERRAIERQGSADRAAGDMPG